MDKQALKRHKREVARKKVGQPKEPKLKLVDIAKGDLGQILRAKEVLVNKTASMQSKGPPTARSASGVNAAKDAIGMLDEFRQPRVVP